MIYRCPRYLKVSLGLASATDLTVFTKHENQVVPTGVTKEDLGVLAVGFADRHTPQNLTRESPGRRSVALSKQHTKSKNERLS